MRLRNSRVGDFYEEAAPPIGRFGVLLGRAIEAQAAIAVLNTLLTLIGLLLLEIPLVAMLSVIVFVCSFVPVLGVLISTTPIVLVALNAGGFGLSLAAIGLVVIVHAVEAYLLNPLIYGKHLKLNPVLTLIILYVGYHAFGFWGLLLGVPRRTLLHPRRARRPVPRPRVTAKPQALLRGLQSNDRAVGLAAAVADLGREVEVAVRALLDVAEAHVHLREHRLATLGLARLIEREALDLQAAQRADEQASLPRAGTCRPCRTRGPTG